MSTPIKKVLLGTGFVLLGAIALHAQNYSYPQRGYPQYGYDPYYSGPVYEEGYSDGYGEEVYDRVQNDLDRAAYDVHGSHRRIDHARKEVGDVQRKLSRGRFDRDEMGEAIGAVEHVLERDSLPDEDRYNLSRDLEGMRRFRNRGYERSERWYR